MTDYLPLLTYSAGAAVGLLSYLTGFYFGAAMQRRVRMGRDITPPKLNQKADVVSDDDGGNYDHPYRTYQH